MRGTTKLGTSLYIETETGWTFAVFLTKSTIRFAAVLCVLFAVLVPNLAAADGWLQFRGPGGLGVSEEVGLPVTWSEGQNLVWKTELPGAGASSPIVIEGKIFLTCYGGYGTGVDPTRGDIGDLKRYVLCLSLADGRIVWNCQVPDTVPDNPRPGNSPQHGYASSTPTSDGQRLYCFFGNSGVYAFTMDGESVWHTRVGDGTHNWGSATSPVLYGNLVIINASVEAGELVAISKENGGVAWKASGIQDSWNTPVLVDVGGRQELVVAVR